MNNVRLRNSIRKHEGLRLKPYLCPSGKLTIGYGRNLDANGITEEEADYLLMTDISRAMDAARNACVAFEDLDAIRQEVLIEMAFQMGGSALAKFTRMHAALARGDYSAAADHALESRWAQQTPQRAQTLAKRLRTGKHETEV